MGVCKTEAAVGCCGGLVIGVIVAGFATTGAGFTEDFCDVSTLEISTPDGTGTKLGTVGGLGAGVLLAGVGLATEGIGAAGAGLEFNAVTWGCDTCCGSVGGAMGCPNCW